MGPMPAGGVPVQNLPQAQRHRGDGREHAVAPRRIPHLATHRENGGGLQQRGPLASQALQEGGDGRNHLVTSSMTGALTPIHTGDARRIPLSV
jgi:hypothetical protein